jgi:arylformamidase
MRIYDLSQEVFTSKVYPGDPSPEKEPIARIADGSPYNLTAFRMCAHNGTHIDAPYHFLEAGKTVDEIRLEAFIGMAYVAEHEGRVAPEDAREMLRKARAIGSGCDRRILIKGRAEVSLEAAEVFAEEKLLLLGNESQTVGPEHAPMAVHKVLLGQEIVLLEGIRLQNVPEGAYLLNAAPLNLAGIDGAPCRAVLISDWERARY